MIPLPPPAKRWSLTLGVIAATAGSLLMLPGCNKETLHNADPTSLTSEENVTPRVAAFVDRAVNRGLQKDGTQISADSAEWYVEAALNYSYSELGLEYNDAAYDTLTYSIPLIGGNVNEGDALDAYTALATNVAAFIIDQQQHVVIVDIVSAIGTNTLDLTAIVGTGSGYTKSINTTYGQNDYWLWGGTSNCNCGSNPNSGNCANAHITQRLVASISGTYGTYMTNIETWNVDQYSTDIPNKNIQLDDFVNPNDNNPGDYLRDFKVYACVSTYGCSTCLSPSDMSFYTQGAYDIMTYIKSNYCNTKTYQFAACYWDFSTCTSCPTYYFHKLKFSYGTPQRR